MPNFKCLNKDCQNYDKIDLIPNVTFKWNENTQRLESEYDPCPVCGERRVTVKDYEGFTDAWFKAESCRNYNNKVVKKYDYDRDAVGQTNLKLEKKKS